MVSNLRVTQNLEEAKAHVPGKSFRSGYPRYAALLGAHESFHNFRRFTRTRMRLLLVKQNEIVALEEKLDILDSSESREVYLGSLHLDANVERAQVLQDLKVALDEYDAMLLRNHQVLDLSRARARDIQNLKDWTVGERCISRRETAYLDEEDDLVNLTGLADTGVAYSASLVESCLFSAQEWLGERFPGVHAIGRHIPREDHIMLLGPHLQRLSRVLAIFVATAVILIPTVVLPGISSLTGRLLASVASAIIFLLFISFFTEARTVDLFASGASYAAVLVALTIGNNDGPGASCCPASSK